MTIHANINIIMGTNTEYTKKYADILAPEGYNINMTENEDISPENSAAKLVILCRTGYELIEKLRAQSDVPIMYIAERSDEISVIMALSKGADIVVPESVSEMEFAARVKAMLRRGSAARSIRSAESAPRMASGGISLDPSSRDVTVNGKRIHTTTLEFEILKYLMSKRGEVCSAERIYAEVWGTGSYDVKKTVIEHIRRLRKKIEPDPSNPEYIKAVFGLGYIFCGGEVPAASAGTASRTSRGVA